MTSRYPTIRVTECAATSPRAMRCSTERAHEEPTATHSSAGKVEGNRHGNRADSAVLPGFPVASPRHAAKLNSLPCRSKAARERIASKREGSLTSASGAVQPTSSSSSLRCAGALRETFGGDAADVVAVDRLCLRWVETWARRCAARLERRAASWRVRPPILPGARARRFALTGGVLLDRIRVP